MRNKIYVMLDPSEAEGLLDLAQREYRDPQRQARLLIADGLRRAGILPENSADHLVTSRPGE